MQFKFKNLLSLYGVTTQSSRQSGVVTSVQLDGVEISIPEWANIAGILAGKSIIYHAKTDSFQFDGIPEDMASKIIDNIREICVFLAKQEGEA